MVPNIPGIPGPPLGGSSSGSSSPSGYNLHTEAKMVSEAHVVCQVGRHALKFLAYPQGGVTRVPLFTTNRQVLAESV